MKNVIVLVITLVLLIESSKAFGTETVNTIPANLQSDEWMLKTEDSTRLYIMEFGAGDTLLIIHGGWGAEHSYLTEAFASLAGKYHLIFYDQRGSLRSPCPESKVTLENHIRDIEAIRKATGQNKLYLIGHSMGGFLGMAYIQKYPQNVKGFIAVSSAPARGTVGNLTEDIQTSALKRWERPEVTDTLKAYGLDLNINKYLTGYQRGLWHRITFSALNMHHVKNWRKLKGAFYYNEKSAAATAATMPNEWDYTAVLNQGLFPVTFIHGDDDYLPLDYHKQTLKNTSRVKLKVINNAGHLCWIDEPMEFMRILKEALEKK